MNDEKIYGPYLRKSDGRQMITIKKEDGKITSKSYPRFLVEKNILLKEEETVHHKDGNPLNNEISNLEILNRKEHASKDSKKLKEKVFECPICFKVFSLSGSRLRNFFYNCKKRKKAGPFCSRECAGKYGAFLQNGYIQKLEPIEIEKEFTK